MTFKQIIDDACERLGNGQPEARVRFRRFANGWCDRILAECSLPAGASTTIAVVSGTEQYTLAAGVDRVRILYDPTNNFELKERPLNFIRRADPGNDMPGIPRYYAYVTDRIIELWPSPSANNTLNLDYEATFADLDEDVDVPIIPSKFHYLLVTGIRHDEYEKNSDKRLAKAERDIGIGIAKLRYYLSSRLSNVPNPGNSVAQASRLGAWYPQGS